MAYLVCYGLVFWSSTEQPRAVSSNPITRYPEGANFRNPLRRRISVAQIRGTDEAFEVLDTWSVYAEWPTEG